VEYFLLAGVRLSLWKTTIDWVFDNSLVKSPKVSQGACLSSGWRLLWKEAYQAQVELKMIKMNALSSGLEASFGRRHIKHRWSLR
jgi:hypothetical protein